jgi:hypothetical protein
MGQTVGIEPEPDSTGRGTRALLHAPLGARGRSTAGRVSFVPVGALGFEPRASCSQSRRANRTALRPEIRQLIAAGSDYTGPGAAATKRVGEEGLEPSQALPSSGSEPDVLPVKLLPNNATHHRRSRDGWI